MNYTSVIKFINFPAMILCPGLFKDPSKARAIRTVMIEWFMRNSEDYYYMHKDYLWPLFRACIKGLSDLNNMCLFCFRSELCSQRPLMISSSVPIHLKLNILGFGNRHFERRQVIMCESCIESIVCRSEGKDLEVSVKLKKRKAEKMGQEKKD